MDLEQKIKNWASSKVSSQQLIVFKANQFQVSVAVTHTHSDEQGMIGLNSLYTGLKFQ